MTRAVRKRLDALRNIPDDVSGSESEPEDILRKEAVDDNAMDLQGKKHGKFEKTNNSQQS